MTHLRCFSAVMMHPLDGCVQAFNLLGLGGPALDNRKV